MACVLCEGPGWFNELGTVVGLPNNSYKPITNTAWVRADFVNYTKGYTRLAAASDKVYQLFAHDRWFSSGTPASSTTKTGRHDIAEVSVKVALNTKKINYVFYVYKHSAELHIENWGRVERTKLEPSTEKVFGKWQLQINDRENRRAMDNAEKLETLGTLDTRGRQNTT